MTIFFAWVVGHIIFELLFGPKYSPTIYPIVAESVCIMFILSGEQICPMEVQDIYTQTASNVCYATSGTTLMDEPFNDSRPNANQSSQTKVGNGTADKV